MRKNLLSRAALSAALCLILFFVCIVFSIYSSALSVLALPLPLTNPSAFPVSDDIGAHCRLIEREGDREGETVPTRHLAIVKIYEDETIQGDVWIPAELLRELESPVRLNDSEDAFTVRVASPANVFGVPALAALAGNALDLEFRARSDDNVRRFNLRGTERVAGVSYRLTDRGTVIVAPSDKLPPADFPKRTPLPTLPAQFNLVWDHVIDDNADLTAEDLPAALDVISPTWFALADETGVSFNKADKAYVEAAHVRGVHVWALVSNSFNRARTRKFLANPKAQDLFIARLLAYARIYGFDGINIDFEGVDNADAARLTAFTRRLTAAAKTMGLVVSIDVMIPSEWSRCYERAPLARIVDYVAVMTYDEHWRSSPKAGSTASLPWVRRGLANTLAEVPADKLLLGIPFYTREWEESRGAGGKISVKSKAMAMASADERLRDTGASKVWLGSAGQHYFQYVSDDKTYKVWMEDESSLKLRMNLVRENNLAGAAFWRKGFERNEVWGAIGAGRRP